MKKIFHTGLLAALLISGATAANAQILAGPVAGGTSSTARLDYTGTKPGTSMVFGGAAGWMVHAPFGNVAVQGALMYSRKGMELNYDLPENDSSFGFKANVKSQLGYITLPLNIVYTTGGDHGFQVLAGGYAALGVGGKREVKVSLVGEGLSGDTTYTSDSFYSDRAHNPLDPILQDEFLTRPELSQETGYFRQIDLGVQAGLGFLTKGGWQVQAQASTGLRNVFTNDINDVKPVNKAMNLSYSLTIAYLFYGK